MIGAETQSALTRLRAWLADRRRAGPSRLPPERELAATLGISRGTLRKALAVLEAEGLIWRQVGAGTFVGDRPVEPRLDLAAVVRRSNPAGVIEARLVFEPELARLAALHATAADLEELALCLRESRAAAEPRAFDSWNDRLHRGIAQATGNGVLLALFDSLATIRRAIPWGRLRRPQRPAADHPALAEHEAIVAAIAERDPQAAAAAMRHHLMRLRRDLLERPAGLAEPAAAALEPAARPPEGTPAEAPAGGPRVPPGGPD